MPVSIELTIEVTYPVAVDTCSGILYTTVQTVGASMTFLATFFGQDPHPSYWDLSKCHSESYNSSVTNGASIGVDYINLYYFNVGLSVVVLVVDVFGFTSKYNRLEAERKERNKKFEGDD